jgi:Protein of unknown function (DUF4240)
MDEKSFWKIIESAKSVNPYTIEAHEKRLVGLLDVLSKDELAAFVHYLKRKAAAAENWDLWAVAWIVRDRFGNYGCGDDAFWGFTMGLVCQGKETYAAALDCPDSLGEYANVAELKECDCLGYSVTRLYREKFGELPPEPEDSEATSNESQEWDEDDLEYFERNFPKTVARWGLPK